MSSLQSRIVNREVRVGVIGLGYVGLPLALVFAEAGVEVVGLDIDQSLVDRLLRGKSFASHISEERIQTVLSNKLFSATTDISRVSECDALMICVPTPLKNSLEPDLRYIESTLHSIAAHLQPNTLVVLESTSWPGTTKEVVKPILEKESSLTCGEDLFIAFSPEREDPGNKAFSTKEIPKLVGAADKKSLEHALALYRLAFDEVVEVSSTGVAEAAKLFENVFRSVNIALVNEFKMILDKMDIDVWEVLQAASTKPFGFLSFWPGPGLGGHCIPVDPFYLSWKAKQVGIETRFIELAGEINRSMPTWVMGKVEECLKGQKKELKGAKILLLGLAYKNDIEDMRGSPSLDLISLMEEKGASVHYHDPLIVEIAKNRSFPKLTGRTSQQPSSNYDCFVHLTSHALFSAEELLSYGVPIVDTRNFFPKDALVFSA